MTSFDLYGDGSVGAVIGGAAEPRPRPRQSLRFLFLLLLGVLVLLRGGAMNVDQIPSGRLEDLFAGRGGDVARLHRVPDRLLAMLLLLHPLQTVHVVSRLRGAIVHGHGETRHVANFPSLRHLSHGPFDALFPAAFFPLLR